MAKYTDNELIQGVLRGEMDDHPANTPEAQELRESNRRELWKFERTVASWTDKDYSVMTEADLLVLLHALGRTVAMVNKYLWVRNKQSLSRKKGGKL